MGVCMSKKKFWKGKKCASLEKFGNLLKRRKTKVAPLTDEEVPSEQLIQILEVSAKNICKNEEFPVREASFGLSPDEEGAEDPEAILKAPLENEIKKKFIWRRVDHFDSWYETLPDNKIRFNADVHQIANVVYVRPAINACQMKQTFECQRRTMV